MAGVAAMHSANDSNVTANKAREALARAVRPAIAPDVYFAGQPDARGLSPAFGRVVSASSNAVDVTVEWQRTQGPPIAARAAKLESWRPNLPDTADASIIVALGPIRDAWWDDIAMVRAVYWDEQRLAQWESLWRPERPRASGGGGWLSFVGMRILAHG
jgi:hypothetical protein